MKGLGSRSMPSGRAARPSQPAPRRQSGQGLAAALAFWVLALAFVAMMVQTQARTSAVTSLGRATTQRMIALAGESALEETSVAMRHPVQFPEPALSALEHGSASGLAHDPLATRDAWDAEVKAGTLTIAPVQYTLISMPSHRPTQDPWIFDLSVDVQATVAGRESMTRRVRRRFQARLTSIIETKGPRQGQTLYSELRMEADPIFEVIE